MIGIFLEIFSIPRSGGTLVFNLTTQMFKWLEINGIATWFGHDQSTLGRAVKKYGALPTQAMAYFPQYVGLEFAINVYRDFRDCVMSVWRVETADIDITDEKNMVRIHDRELQKHISTLKRRIMDLNRFKVGWPDERVLLLKYEDFYKNYNLVFDGILNKINTLNDLNLNIPEDVRNDIIEEWSRSNVRKMQSKFNSFQEWDTNNNIHGNHVSTGESAWKQYLHEQDHEELTDIFKDDLIKWGYEL